MTSLMMFARVIDADARTMCAARTTEMSVKSISVKREPLLSRRMDLSVVHKNAEPRVPWGAICSGSQVFRFRRSYMSANLPSRHTRCSVPVPPRPVEPIKTGVMEDVLRWNMQDVF
jgi:hypothetical protein